MPKIIKKAEATSIFKAISDSDYSAIKKLAKEGQAEKIKHGHTPLSLAVTKAMPRVTQVLLEAGADANFKKADETPLYTSSWRANHTMAKMLIPYSDVNTQGPVGWAPIHAAALHNGLDIVRDLLEAGAKVNIKNDIGNTALTLAASRGHKEVVKLLLEHGANIDSQNTNGSTAIHTACIYGHVDTVKLLIRKKANVKIIDDFGNSIMHAAGFSGKEVLFDLLKKKASQKLLQENQKGQTPATILIMNKVAETANDTSEEDSASEEDFSEEIAS